MGKMYGTGRYGNNGCEILFAGAVEKLERKGKMAIRIESIDDYNKVVDTLPQNVVKIIDKRLMNWLLQGGEIDADYVKTQFKYAEGIVNMQASKGR